MSISNEISIPFCNSKCSHDCFLSQKTTKTHEETCCYNCRNDWNKNVTESTDRTLKSITLFSSFSFLLTSSRCWQTKGNHFIVDFVYCTSPKDDLVLTRVEESTLYFFDVFDCILVDFSFINNHNTKASRTVGNATYVFASAKSVNDFFCNFCIVHLAKISL